MANWFGQGRTNYFKVKDEDAFRAAMAELDVVVIGSDGRVGLTTGDAGEGSWPGWDQEGNDIEVPNLVAEHLVEGQVAIFQEVGWEKMRYLTGWALAINSTGATHHISIDQITDFAREMGSEVTNPSY